MIIDRESHDKVVVGLLTEITLRCKKEEELQQVLDASEQLRRVNQEKIRELEKIILERDGEIFGLRKKHKL